MSPTAWRRHQPDGSPFVTAYEQLNAGGWTVERHVVGPHRTNAYIAGNGDGCLVVDPAAEADHLLSSLARAPSPVRAILLTHAHWDHFGAAAALQRATGAPVVLHREEQRLLRMAPSYARAVDRIDFEVPDRVCFWGDAESGALGLGAELAILHVPGHSRGGVVIRAGSFVFTGDTLLRERAGSCKPPFGNRAALEGSLDTLRACIRPEDTLLGGHGQAWSGSEARRWLDAFLSTHVATLGG